MYIYVNPPTPAAAGGARQRRNYQQHVLRPELGRTQASCKNKQASWKLAAQAQEGKQNEGLKLVF